MYEHLNLRERLNWVSRERIVETLEGEACIACYDEESTSLLRDTLVESIEAGDCIEPEQDCEYQDGVPGGPFRPMKGGGS